MTIKEYNGIRAAVYEAAIKNDEIAKAIDIAGIAYIYEVQEPGGQHKIFVLTARTQFNSNTLREAGFDPENIDYHLVMSLHRNTKTASFS